MKAKQVNPLEYVFVQTKLPVHMHTWFSALAAQRRTPRFIVYMYALRFAFQSGKEFIAFLDAVQKKGAKNG